MWRSDLTPVSDSAAAALAVMPGAVENLGCGL